MALAANAVEREMSQTLTVPQFVLAMARVVATLPVARHHALEHAAVIVETEAKRVIGTYDARPEWPDLADTTKEDRVRQGYPENEPLLRTGEMRDSIEHTVVSSHEAQVGSNNDKAVWQELGTRTIPPRSFLKSSVVRKVKEIEHAIGYTMHAHLSSGGKSDAGHAFDVVKQKIL